MQQNSIRSQTKNRPAVAYSKAGFLIFFHKYAIISLNKVIFKGTTQEILSWVVFLYKEILMSVIKKMKLTDIIQILRLLEILINIIDKLGLF